MLIDIGKNTLKEINKYESYRKDHICILWKGFFFIRGYRAGIESVKVFCDVLLEGKVSTLRDLFGGAFICVVKDDKKQEIYAFTDSNHLNCLFISDGFLSDSFLEILNARETNEFDSQSLAEYLVYGQCFFNKTLIKGVFLSDNECYYQVANSHMECKRKKNSSIDEPPKINNHQEFFKDIIYALNGEEISLALTGGYDSRYVLTLLDEANVNTSISGDNSKNKDIALSEEVAKAFGKKHSVFNANKPKVSEDYYRNMFIRLDGIPFGFMDSNIRLYEYLTNRAENYKLHVTGDTGVLHKGENWIMDFPFYHKRKFNPMLYYRMLILQIKDQSPYSDDFNTICKENEETIQNWLENNRKAINTKSYDYYDMMISFEFNRRQLVMAESNIIGIYCPLMENEVVRYSYHMRRRKRFRATSMKEVMTSRNKTAARISTTLGTSASSELKYRFRDSLIDARNFMVKLLRLLNRLIRKKSLFIGNVLTWTCESEFRNLECVKKSITYAKQEGILKQSITEEQLSYSTLSRLLEIYFLSEY